MSNGATQLRAIHDFDGRESEDVEKRYFEDGTAGCPFCARADSGQADGAFSSGVDRVFARNRRRWSFGEDSKSGKNYLDDVKIHLRAQLHVTVTHCGKTDTPGIVTEAIRRSRHFDRVFCVIDRDEHPNFDSGCDGG